MQSNLERDKTEQWKASRVCTFCGAALVDNCEFCPKCGRKKHQAGQCSCPVCGMTLTEDYDFCPKCGTPKQAVARGAVCSACGFALRKDQDFCPKCGQRIMPGQAPLLNREISASVNRYNTGVVQKRKRNIILPAAIAGGLILVLLSGLFIHSALEEKRAQEVAESKEIYLSDAQAFCAAVSEAETILENMTAMCEENLHYAVLSAPDYKITQEVIEHTLLSRPNEISLIKSQCEVIQMLYEKLKALPNGVDDLEYEKIRLAVADLYESYMGYYQFALDNSSKDYNEYLAQNKSQKDTIYFCLQILDGLV